MRRALRRIAILLLAFLLAACDGDDGGTGPSLSTSVPSGTYQGTANLLVSGGGASASTTGPIVIVVSENLVQVGVFDPVPLNGNSFHASLPYTFFNQPGNGLSCTQGTLNVDGTFTGTSVSGPISSPGLVCNGIAMTTTGSYTATLTAQTRQDGHAGEDFVTSVRETLTRILPR